MPDESVEPAEQQSAGQISPEEEPLPPMPHIHLMKQGTGWKKPLLAVAIILMIAAGAYILLAKPPKTTTTTTVIGAGVAVTGCRSINASGNYYFTSNIKTSVQSGACINITADNVNLACNQDKLIGSGPYASVPPFTYGIEVSSRSNVSISGCTVRNFSYGIYESSSRDTSISGSNATTNYLSNIYLSNTSDSSVYDNILSGSASSQGSLYIGNGSTGDKIYNNTVLRSQYYGIAVNSSGNSFLNNSVNATPVSFYCGINHGFKDNNTANSNICYNNTGCGFLQCQGINIPADLSQIRLSSAVSSCGSISKPGRYSMSGSVNMGAYVNVSAALPYGIPCISIRSSSVALDCRNFSVYNSTFGIVANAVSNVTISNCNVRDSDIGVRLTGVGGSSLYNMTLYNDSTGVLLQNSSVDLLSNVKERGGIYGAYLYDSPSDTYQNFNFSNNLYGIYVNGSVGDTFSDGVIVNNSELDVYATNSSMGTGYNLMQLTKCGITNAKWAACNRHTTTGMAYVPVSSCMAISKGGNYSLTSNIVNAQPDCISIKAGNVTFNCASHSINAPPGTLGSGIYINGSSNVTIGSCNLFGFATSVSAYNSLGVELSGINATIGNYGIALFNVSNSSVSDSSLTGTAEASIMLDNVKGSSIISDSLSGAGENTGIYLNDSVRNLVLDNRMSGDYIGMYITGNSLNNTINNNTAQLSKSFDYYCNGDSGIDSEQGGLDYGSTKSGCNWLAVLLQSSPAIACSAAEQPSSIFLTNDARFSYNSICYSVYAPTTINCNGHTVISTNGGTFAMFRNAGITSMANCYLKGFLEPVTVINSSTSVMNSTIYMNLTGTAINVTDSQSPAIEYDNITLAYQGVNITNSIAGTLRNNIVDGANVAYLLLNDTTFTVQDNTAAASDEIGLYMSGSAMNLFSDNNFSASASGLECGPLSQGNRTNQDNGGNICSSNSGCSWIKSSALECHG
jgi:parallel beta-helix repeat protein